MSKLFVPDTNIILDEIESLQGYTLVLLSHTLRELEKHKSNKRDAELSYRARKAVRYIKSNRDKFIFDTKDYDGSEYGDNSYEDNRIMKAVVENDYGLITNDILLGFRAEGLGIEVVNLDESDDFDEDYTGVHEIYLTNSKEDHELLASLYEQPHLNPFNLVTNQYLYVWDKSKPTYKDGEQNGYELVDNFKFDGFKLNKLKYKPVYSKHTGEKIKPINRKQEMLFDMLQNSNNTINICLGKYGVGKDFVMISHALDLVESGKMDKIIWARNNVELADVPTLGILPGDKIEKLIEFAMPLADHVGGLDGLELLLRQGKIEIQHLGSLRGRDIKNSIIYVTECQNNTKEHFQLLIGRVGQGSQLWLNGDLKQTDKEVFKKNSGIKALSKLKGHHLFGQVTLDKTERSDTAQLAELLD